MATTPAPAPRKPKPPAHLSTTEPPDFALPELPIGFFRGKRIFGGKSILRRKRK